MTRRVFKYLALAALTAGGISACNPITGVHLNSQVLGGSGVGWVPEPLTPRAPDAAPSVQTEELASNETKTWGTPLGSSAAQAPAVDSAPLTAAPVAAAPVASAQPVKPAPVLAQPSSSAAPIASAQSFVGQKTTVAGLGDPGRDGLWMETPLVSSRRNARLTAPNGKSVVVTLEPISGDAGQGSRLSIDGMRALGLPLTELVELKVGPA
ncbi:hypothetical protein [Arenibacterium sp. LLYu02]|uniref:hypothetical protein n=1 Tax=Arenibacterium sp. LLYu02 TaxID=3404132 RepID=UPI003B2112AE